VRACTDGAYHWNNAGDLLVFTHACCARAGAFATNVEHGRTFVNASLGVGERGVDMQMLAAISEAVGRDVENRHDARR
jgi:L-alanine-DL-glutamate epimerase-like enolase superfamily enzyme